MDHAQVRGLFATILEPAANARQEAEEHLKQIHNHASFLDVLMDIVQGEQDAQVRLSAAIYLKNRINNCWSQLEPESSDYVIADEIKARVRERFLPIMVGSEGLVRPQLVPALQRILHNDFPEQWPTFMDYTMELLNTNTPLSVLTGLQCLLAICRTYRYKSSHSGDDGRAHFDQIIELSFPRLLAICNELVNQDSDEAGEMLHIALKCYKHSTWLELNDFLRQPDVSLAWCSVFLQTVRKVAPPNAMSGDSPYEREVHHWWKAKKWAYFNLNRMFVRHGNPSAFAKSTAPAALEFAKSFTEKIAPEILQAYLQEVEKWVAKTTWLSRPCLSYIIVFLDECIRPKSMWKHLKPHLQTLVTHFIFPVMCLSEDDLERFEDEPEEYLHRKLNQFEEAGSPDMAATNFLTDLTKHQRKQTFEILKFVNTVVNEYEQAADDKKNHVAKEGALRMIGTLSSVILGKKSPIADQVEYFLVRYVFPEFRSPQAFLRARACDTIEKFEQLDFTDQNNLLTIYNNILESLNDTELPVRVTAALALQPLIRHDLVRVHMQQSIPQVMQQLLKLANEVDVDALTNVMEDFVEVFAAELTPFAVALSEQLRDTYLRIIRDMLDKTEKNGGPGMSDQHDDEFGDVLDEKSITALGVLQTIGTLILTLESTPEVLATIETTLMPVIEVTLENKLYDLYNEIFEIIDSCTFASRSISPTMWKAFELLHVTFKNGAELYLEDMLPALENFVQFGSAELAQMPNYVQALYSMVAYMFSDENMGGHDRIPACKLAESMMLCLPSSIDSCALGYVEMAMSVLSDRDVKHRAYRLHLLEMVVSALYYNPLLTLQALETKNWTNRFFTLWFSNISLFKRVHDKKLCIIAISRLLNIDAGQVPASVSTGWPRLLHGLAELFRTLPQALQKREEALKDDLTYDPSLDFGDDDEWTEKDAQWVQGSGEDVDDDDAAGAAAGGGDGGHGGSSTYLDFLNAQTQQFQILEGDGEESDDDEDDEELGEDSVMPDSALEKVEPYELFATSFNKLQQEQTQFYNQLWSQLPQEDQEEIQRTLMAAQQKVMEKMNAAE